MDKKWEKFKGIHPGIILERELRRRSLAQRPFAHSIGIAPQSFNKIIKGIRSLPLPSALKTDHALGIEEGTFALLQTYYNIQREIEKNENAKPDLSLLRKALFWDTNIDHINWERQYRAVIRRVFERGNNQEKKEILRFYGKEKVKEITGKDTIAANNLHIMSSLNVR